MIGKLLLQEHHEGYITWNDYLENLKRLEQNQTNGKETLLPGPVREGLALLHGLLVCSYCGHKITVRYQGNGGIQPYYQCSWKRKEGATGVKDCLSIRCEPVDQHVSQRVLSVIEPKQIQIAIDALNELENRQQGVIFEFQSLWLTLEWTCTTLMLRPHGRTIPRTSRGTSGLE